MLLYTICKSRKCVLLFRINLRAFYRQCRVATPLSILLQMASSSGRGRRRLQSVCEEIGETTRHISIRVCEHLVSDKASHVYKHLQSSGTCHDSSSAETFTILDSATSSVQVKIKEALYIKWEFPTPNQKLRHLDLSLSF